MFINGIKKKARNVRGADPFEFNAMGCSQEISSDELLDFGIKELKDALIEDFNKGFEALMKYEDKMFVRTYMQRFLKQIDETNVPGISR